MIATPQQRVQSNLKQQSKLAYKRREVLRLANSIDDEIRLLGIHLPRTYIDYQDNKHKLLEAAGYDMCDELHKWFSNEYDELIKLQYTLRRTNKAVYALFENQNKVVKPMLVSMWYTKHRMDEVWLMRKSQLIRSIYREYLQTATIPTGELLIKTYTPAHLVLTVPHDKTGFDGETFYLKKLLQLFHELRRSKTWKQLCYGGEYGVEVKKSNNDNGLHIHIHSLIFINNVSSINTFRKFITDRWAKLTGNPGRAFIHLEQLFTYKKDEQGNWITKNGVKKNERTGEYEDLYDIVFDENDNAEIKPKKVRQKFYVGTDSPIDEYLQGVMECIKYHFKSDTYKCEDGSYDLPLIREILNNSKNVRFYSRYGAFYRCKQLNFDWREEAPDEEAIEGKEDNLNGSATRGVRELINPFTFEPAVETDYDFAIASPEMLKYASGKDLVPYHLMSYGTAEFKRLAKGLEINEIIKGMVLGKTATMIIKEPAHAAHYDRKTMLLNST